LISVSIVSLGCACLATAQGPSGMAAEVTQSYTAVKNNILKTADKMPDADYSFKPTPEVRSFAEVLDHVADSQMHTCAAIAGDQKTASAGGKATKADVAAALNDAFAECDKAYGSLSDANAAEPVKTPRGQRSKLGLLADNTGHDREQYGILAMYLRLKGIVPPSSDRTPQR
jgi:uncharacterized damage-inducible protein DinB